MRTRRRYKPPAFPWYLLYSAKRHGRRTHWDKGLQHKRQPNADGKSEYLLSRTVRQKRLSEVIITSLSHRRSKVSNELHIEIRWKACLWREVTSLLWIGRFRRGHYRPIRDRRQKSSISGRFSLYGRGRDYGQSKSGSNRENAESKLNLPFAIGA